MAKSINTRKNLIIFINSLFQDYLQATLKQIHEQNNKLVWEKLCLVDENALPILVALQLTR